MKRIISIIITIAMIMTSVQAAEWISISQWSYQAISEIVSSDLLPDCLKGVGDYKRIINRGEFCELVYSVLKKNKLITEERTVDFYTDTKSYPSVNLLYAVIYEAREDGNELKPTNSTTRNWAARIIFQVLQNSGLYDWYNEKATLENQETAKAQINDYDKIEEFDKISWVINSGIMCDVDNGFFMPNAEMTIEQAVTAVYRMYKAIPRVIKSDNEMGDDVREIGSGVLEEITDTAYNIKKDGRLLISLENDVYQKVFATEYKEQLLLFAVNFNNKTDVFDTDTAQIIYTIPHIVTELDPSKGYAYTISGKYMPYYSGIWSMDNYEIYPTEYSRYELQAMLGGKKNEYRRPEGVLYYADWNDNGNMYRVDSNGENKTLIVDGHDCTGLQLVYDKIYFQDNIRDLQLYRVNPDGSGLTEISSKRAYFQGIYTHALDPYKIQDELSWDKENLGFYDIENHGLYPTDYDYNYQTDIYGDKSVVYTEIDEDAMTREVGDLYTAKRRGETLFRYTEDGQSIKLADFYVTSTNAAHNGDGKIYFMDAQKLYETGESPIYVSDNNKLRIISGNYNAASFGFWYNTKTNKVDFSKIAFMTQSDVDDNTYRIIDVKTGRISEKKYLEQRVDESRYDEDGCYYFKMSDTDEVRFFRGDADGLFSLYADYNGKITKLGDGNVECVMGDYAYFTSARVMHVMNSLSRQKTVDPLKRVNYKTGEISIVDNDFATQIYTENNCIYYNTVLGEIKLISNASDPVTVYPCKGIYKYGEIKLITHAPKILGQKTSYYKFDIDGNLSRLTENDSQRGLYIPFNSDSKKVYVWR